MVSIIRHYLIGGVIKMTEFETMIRAKEYIDKLANGINPLTDTEALNDTVLNNVRLSRCFFFVSQVLNKVIANGGNVIKTSGRGKMPCKFTDEQKKQIQLSETSIAISIFTDAINAVVELDTYKKINAPQITNWLVEKGFLQVKQEFDGKNKKAITANSGLIGISSEKKISSYGREYEAILYNKSAQAFIIDNLDEILKEKE